MPGLDYSRFDNLDDSGSEDEAAKGKAETESPAVVQAREVLKDLPKDIPPELSLVLAARLGQHNVVEALLTTKAAVDSPDPHGGTALLRAVEGGIANRPSIELLVKHGASVSRCGKDGRSPLSVAAGAGPAELCQTLLQSATASEAWGGALVAAAASRNCATTRLLLDARASATAKNRDGCTALHRWAEADDTSGLDLLLSAGAGTDELDAEGRTPLVCAARRGCVAAVRCLSAAGASTNVAARDGLTALTAAAEWAAGGGDRHADDMVRVLLEHGASPHVVAAPTARSATAKRAPSPLVAAAISGQSALVAMLLEAKADAEAADDSGRRPLPCAVVGRRLEGCQLLLDARAAVDSRGLPGGRGQNAAEGEVAGGVTGLSIAAAIGAVSIAKLLLSAKASVSVVDERHRTPLMAAAQHGSAEICAAILAADADANALQADTDKTALLFAATAGHVPACEVLVRAGAVVNTQGCTGSAPLHAAAANGHSDVCKLLLESSASPALKGPGGRTALEVASAAGHSSIEELFRCSEKPVDA